MRRRCAALAAAALAVAITGVREADAVATISLSITSGNPIQFAPTDVTNASFPATATMTVSLNITTLLGGGGTIAVVAPASIVGSGGNALDPSLITFTCTRGTAGTWFNSTGVVTVVPGGTSAACATIPSNTVLASGTFIVSMFINDRYDAPHPLPADTWSSGAFSVLGTAT
ncbi:MAG: hypothetical protein JO103_10895 [Candidatus Eremiobacteraeota bacterium]|nr:hypothetical protein [Candidatus Eremiobacteraeota bacterium]